VPKEAPFISRALKLVSLALILATVSIAITAAYSGYQEYGALTSSIEGSSNSNQLDASLNGTTLIISGLVVPNKMTFPLTLELIGGVSLNNISVGKFDSGAYVIQPNESKGINVTVPLTFSNLLLNSNALQNAAFNSTEISVSTTISAHMVPLLGINITKLANESAGPIFGNLQAGINLTSIRNSSGGNLLVPLSLTWQNSSPLSNGSLWALVNLTSIPGKSGGSYGSGSGLVSLVQGSNSQTIVLRLPKSDFNGKNFSPGSYSFDIQLSETNSSQPFASIQRTVSV
jgi:hypothetical protein